MSPTLLDFYFNLLKSFPDLRELHFPWNSVYQSKDLEVLVDFERLSKIQINYRVIAGSLSDETVEEIRA